MKDRLTKKRIKVDYYKIICLLGLANEFVKFCYDRRQCSLVSFNRRAYSFLKHKKVDLYTCSLYLKDYPFADHSKLLLDTDGDLSYFYEL